MNDIPLEPAAPARSGLTVDAVVRHFADLLEPGPPHCGPGDGEIADVLIAEPGEPLDWYAQKATAACCLRRPGARWSALAGAGEAAVISRRLGREWQREVAAKIDAPRKRRAEVAGRWESGTNLARGRLTDSNTAKAQVLDCVRDLGLRVKSGRRESNSRSEPGKH
ncbi:hypothetical protein ACFV0Z_09940 [Streptomyces xiamenensis]|uniref:hypothetical protein n=1 Tax=Streptomyces xiamenensis TaxID=408015 RepID=UPI00367B3590